MAGWEPWGLPLPSVGWPAATAGWNDDGRRACLHWVACLSRFRPGIKCRNLAVLGRVAKGDDFEARYGYRSYLLETFDEKHEGASFLAANWRRVGKISGRRGAEMPKAVYMHELDAEWRERLRIPRLAPLGVGAGLDRKSWAEQEFGGAPLGDMRLSARLVTCARHQAEAPMRAFTGAARGDRNLGILPFHRQARRLRCAIFCRPAARPTPRESLRPPTDRSARAVRALKFQNKWRMSLRCCAANPKRAGPAA